MWCATLRGVDEEVREALLGLRFGGQQLIDLADAYLADEEAAARDGGLLVRLAREVTEAGRNWKQPLA